MPVVEQCRKSAIRFVMSSISSIRLTVHIKQHCSHRSNFRNSLYPYTDYALSRFHVTCYRNVNQCIVTWSIHPRLHPSQASPPSALQRHFFPTRYCFNWLLKFQESSAWGTTWPLFVTPSPTTSQLCIQRRSPQLSCFDLPKESQ
jgi:hypothetical protein